MGETTEISWTDSTWNPWWGCARVSEACQHCYAESLAKRFGTEWGKTADRRFFGDKHWNDPLRWNRAAQKARKPRLVFCASMADVFEDRDDLSPHRERLWDLIGRTPWLTWQLLTKRPENISSMVPDAWYAPRAWPVNVWVGTTVETQRWADERLPLLSKVPAPVRFISAEPLFEHLNLSDHLAYQGSPGANWAIAGGESGGKARPSHPDWFRNLRDTCAALGVPFLFKQWGEYGPVGPPERLVIVADDGTVYQRGDLDYPDGPRRGEAIRAGHDHANLTAMYRVGKKAAGRELDGRTWDDMPERANA